MWINLSFNQYSTTKKSSTYYIKMDKSFWTYSIIEIIMWIYLSFKQYNTTMPRCLARFLLFTYYIKVDKSFWTYSIMEIIMWIYSSFNEYSTTKKSCPIFVVFLQHINGQDFLDIQYYGKIDLCLQRREKKIKYS